MTENPFPAAMYALRAGQLLYEISGARLDDDTVLVYFESLEPDQFHPWRKFTQITVEPIEGGVRFVHTRQEIRGSDVTGTQEVYTLTPETINRGTMAVERTSLSTGSVDYPYVRFTNRKGP